MKKLGLYAGGVLIALICILLIKTFSLPSNEYHVAGSNQAVPETYDGEMIANNLSKALQIRTLSHSDGARVEAAAFAEFADFLEETYPAFHNVAMRETVNHSLLYRWPGKNGNAKPVGLLAHIDVVPAENVENSAWTHPPFSGAIADGYIWGRGTLDDKGSLIAMLEAAERLTAAGFTPARDVYFLFGHDEEIGGDDGAGAIAALLKDRGIQFSFTLDEGSAITLGIINGVKRPVALISTAEKGYLNLRLTARGDGGHSSSPPPKQPLPKLRRQWWLYQIIRTRPALMARLFSYCIRSRMKHHSHNASSYPISGFSDQS